MEEKKVTLIFIMYHLCVYEVSYKILRLLRLTADLSNEPKIEDFKVMLLGLTADPSDEPKGYSDLRLIIIDKLKKF